MPAFPFLKSGAITQYPSQQSTRFRSESVEFLDGSRQRYSLYGSGLRRWQIALTLLDDAELNAVVAFVAAQGSTAFAFTDPASGQSIAKCVISGDAAQWTGKGEMQGEAQLVIEELS